MKQEGKIKSKNKRREKMANLEEFLSLLEEKLVRLNHDREDVQNQVQGVCSKVTE